MRQNECVNTIELAGILKSPFEYSHTAFEERFFSAKLQVPRLSGCVDILPITASQRLLCGCEKISDCSVLLTGQIRSYNQPVTKGAKLLLTAFAKELTFSSYAPPQNLVQLTGYLCKPPIYRTTPLCREICDLLIAVNRSFGKSDYIPCIAWGKNARIASRLGVGQAVALRGRMQSREYQKLQPDGSAILRIAYEVSLTSIEPV